MADCKHVWVVEGFVCAECGAARATPPPEFESLRAEVRALTNRLAKANEQIDRLTRYAREREAERDALTQRLEEAEKRGDAFRDEAMAAKARRNRAEDALLREVGEKNAALARAEAAEKERDTAMAQVMVRYTKTDEDLAAARAEVERMRGAMRRMARVAVIFSDPHVQPRRVLWWWMKAFARRARALAGPSAAPPSGAPTKGDER